MLAWLRYRYALLVGRFRAAQLQRRARRDSRPAPGQPEREAAWLLWGVSFLFRPAAIASAAMQIAADREQQKARLAALRRVRAWAIALSAGAALLSLVLYLLR